MRKFIGKAGALAAAGFLLAATALHAQTRVLWDWSAFDIVHNDEIGRNYNAHTIAKHVGKSDAYLRDRTVYEGKQCASTFWNTYEANYWIRGALQDEDRFRQQYGYPDLWSTIQNARDYSQVILRRFDFDPNIGWFHGIYVKELGKIYGANGVRVVIKKVPYSVSGEGYIVEVAYPEMDPMNYYWCGS
ncbi:MAG TPA: RNase A-like domain-containing protein [Allosphingosinicella sp.]|jgi:hypothetical protein